MANTMNYVIISKKQDELYNIRVGIIIAQRNVLAAKRPIPLYDFTAFGKAIKEARTKRGESRKNNYDTKSLLFSDIAVDATQEAIMAVNGDMKLFFSDNPKAIGISWFGHISNGSFVGVATGEAWNEYGFNYTRFYALDAAGQIITCDLDFNPWMGGWSITMGYYEFDKEMTFNVDENGVYQDTLIYNAVTGTPILFHYTEDATQVYALSLDDATETASPILPGEIKDFDTLSAYKIEYMGAAQESATPVVDTQAQQAVLNTAQETIPMGSTNVYTGAPANGIFPFISVGPGDRNRFKLRAYANP